jgi:adenylylsulfate kinase-like enzyme
VIPKGLYEKAKKGEIKGLTGYDGVYEESENADLTINTDKLSVDEVISELIKKVNETT